MTFKKLIKINIKSPTYYYWNKLINKDDLDLQNVLANKVLPENCSIY